MPTVSVIIPVYNRADVLPRAMNSVLDQTFEDFELIIVDDGSTEDIEAVVDGYDDPRVTYLPHLRNRGGSAARNTGIQHATGEYVAFLDSDDVWRPEKLERQVRLLESRGDDWVAAYCGVESVFPDRWGALKKQALSLLPRGHSTTDAEGGSELIAEVLCDRLHTSAGSTLLVRGDVAEAIDGFDESFDRFQDPEFLIRVLEQGKLGVVDEPLVERYESGSPSADAVRESDEHFLSTFEETISRLEAAGYDVVGAHHLILAKLYLREGRLATGLRYLYTARRPAPGQYPGLFLTVVSGVKRRVTAAV